MVVLDCFLLPSLLSALGFGVPGAHSTVSVAIRLFSGVVGYSGSAERSTGFPIILLKSSSVTVVIDVECLGFLISGITSTTAISIFCVTKTDAWYSSSSSELISSCMVFLFALTFCCLYCDWLIIWRFDVSCSVGFSQGFCFWSRFIFCFLFRFFLKCVWSRRIDRCRSACPLW